MADQENKRTVCPNCGKEIRRAVTNREFGGQVHKCPWCKTEFSLDAQGNNNSEQRGQ